MPNGKPGDDWFTDIVAHGLPTFAPNVDRLVRDIAAASGGTRYDPLDSLVNRHLDAIGHEELASRSATVGMEYRHLRPNELDLLEEDLQLLRAEIKRR
jgi:hypothetical protein